MAKLTGKGLTKLETLRDYWPPRPHFSSVKMRQKYLLREIEKDPGFYIEQHSILRKDWNRLKQVMDAIEDLLPDKIKIVWKIVEELHDSGLIKS